MKTTNNVLIRDQKLLDEGFLAVCDGVAETFGGEGKYGLLDSGNNQELPSLTKDGVSVAQRIRFANPVKNFGALQAIQSAIRALKKSGDSTTTTLIFCQGFLRNLKRHKFNKAVERGIEKGVKEVIREINFLKKDTTPETLKRIAITSCNNDVELGSKIIEAFDFVGYDGIVEVSKNESSDDIKINEQKGMIIKNQGYASPFFINSESKPVFEGENIAVACFQIWQENQDIIGFVKEFVTQNGQKTPLVIVTERPIAELKERFCVFKQAGLNICLIGLAVTSEYENVTLINDIASFTSGESYHPDTVQRTNTGAPIIKFGMADKIIVSDTETVISVKETPKAVTETVENLKSKEKRTRYEEERLKRLVGKSCIIEVGGFSPNDIREKFDRVDDALFSVKTALEDGYIPGGGSALVFISNRMNTRLENSEEQVGYNLVKKVLNEPFLRILKNANRKQSVFPLLGKNYMKHSKETFGVGYNATTDSVRNLIDDGIIDSAKSIKVALESAKETAIKMFNIGVITVYP